MRGSGRTLKEVDGRLGRRSYANKTGDVCKGEFQMRRDMLMRDTCAPLSLPTSSRSGRGHANERILSGRPGRGYANEAGQLRHPRRASLFRVLKGQGRPPSGPEGRPGSGPACRGTGASGSSRGGRPQGETARWGPEEGQAGEQGGEGP